MQTQAASPVGSDKISSVLARQQEVVPTAQIPQYRGDSIAAAMLRLQRTYGNCFVQRVIQTKLEVSHPGDPYEQEADQVADRIMRMPTEPARPVMQRAATPEKEKDKEESQQPVAVKRMPAGSAQIPSREKEKEEEKPDQIIAAARTAEDEMQNGVLPHAEEAVSAASNSTGHPLPPSLQRRFEQGLGVDLSAVRLHTGPQSVEASKAISARAFTTGNDIHFNQGQYDPENQEGQRLLAHEVTHTVQQTGAIQRDNKTPDQPGFGTIKGAGDEAELRSEKAPLQVDSISVQTDRSRVGELIKDIVAANKVIEPAEKENSDMEAQYAPLATNTATKANLEVFDQKLDVSAVDTTAFAVQYRIAYGDYQRLTAEATEFLSLGGAHIDDALGAVGDAFAKTPGLKLDSSKAGVERFRAARQNMNTAGKRMDSQLNNCRTAANLLQGAVNNARSAAAAATGKDAATKLAALRAEIAEVAGGVATVIKICTAMAGLAGGGGAVNALGTATASKESGGHTDIDPSRSGLATGGTVLDPQEASKLALLKAMGTDVAAVAGGGGPEAMAKNLVTAIGNYANKDKITSLQQNIVKAAAEETSFKAAADAQSMVGYQDQMETASKQLALLLEAFASARQELADASQALMEQLNKGGKQGKDQAKGVLFLSDADRFLAQVTNSISVGENQQANLRQAVKDRKALRGTTHATEGGADQSSQYYFRCTKTVVPGKLWGTNNIYRLEKVYVTFQNSDGFGQNDINQGGAGTIEGTGSAADEVANKLQILNKAKEQVTMLQAKIQGAIGMPKPGLNA